MIKAYNFKHRGKLHDLRESIRCAEKDHYLNMMSSLLNKENGHKLNTINLKVLDLSDYLVEEKMLLSSDNINLKFRRMRK